MGSSVKKSWLIANLLENATGQSPKRGLEPPKSTKSYAFKKPDLIERKPPIRGSAVFYHMIDGSCLRNGNHRVFDNAPVQCHLGFRLTRHRCPVGEDVFRIFQFDVGQPLGQRTIGDYGDTVFLAVVQEL